MVRRERGRHSHHGRRDEHNHHHHHRHVEAAVPAQIRPQRRSLATRKECMGTQKRRQKERRAPTRNRPINRRPSLTLYLQQMQPQQPPTQQCKRPTPRTICPSPHPNRITTCQQRRAGPKQSSSWGNPCPPRRTKHQPGVPPADTAMPTLDLSMSAGIPPSREGETYMQQRVERHRQAQQSQDASATPAAIPSSGVKAPPQAPGRLSPARPKAPPDQPQASTTAAEPPVKQPPVRPDDRPGAGVRQSPPAAEQQQRKAPQPKPPPTHLRHEEAHPQGRATAAAATGSSPPKQNTGSIPSKRQPLQPNFQHSQPTALYRQVFGPPPSQTQPPMEHDAAAGGTTQVNQDAPPQRRQPLGTGAMRAAGHHAHGAHDDDQQQDEQQQQPAAEPEAEWAQHQTAGPAAAAEATASAAASSSRARSHQPLQRGVQPLPQRPQHWAAMEPWGRKRRPWQPPPRQIPTGQHDFHDRPQQPEPDQQQAVESNTDNNLLPQHQPEEQHPDPATGDPGSAIPHDQTQEQQTQPSQPPQRFQRQQSQASQSQTQATQQHQPAAAQPTSSHNPGTQGTQPAQPVQGPYQHSNKTLLQRTARAAQPTEGSNPSKASHKTRGAPPCILTVTSRQQLLAHRATRAPRAQQHSNSTGHVTPPGAGDQRTRNKANKTWIHAEFAKRGWGKPPHLTWRQVEHWLYLKDPQRGQQAGAPRTPAQPGPY